MCGEGTEEFDVALASGFAGLGDPRGVFGGAGRGFVGAAVREEVRDEGLFGGLWRRQRPASRLVARGVWEAGGPWCHLGVVWCWCW